MGSGRDKRKKGKKGSSTAGQGAAKTERKLQRKDEKRSRRAERGDDIDAILTQLNMRADREVQIETNCAAPSPRVCSVWLPNGDQGMQRREEILLFGGEWCDHVTGKVYMYDDLFAFDPGTLRWRRIRSSGPKPRSACAGAVHRGHLYVFGGEFTSPNQEKFKHFRDLWRLDLSSWQWDELPTKGGPSARSGHRMLCYQGRLYLFGGYYDNGAEVPKYYSDMWCFDTATLKWETLGDVRALWPPARSGYQWVLHGDRIVMHGGYVKRKDSDEHDMEHGVALNDTWAWHIPTSKHKESAYLFGGAADEEARGGETLVTNFFNELYQLNLAQGRWYPVALRTRPDRAGAGVAGESQRPLGTIVDSESDRDLARQRAATRIQARYRGHVVRKAYKLYRIGGTISEVLYSPAAYGVDLTSRNAPKPRARINANACVVGNTLWLFGGLVEIGDREVTLDDIWTVDLAKKHGWVPIKDNTIGQEDFAALGADGDASSDTSEDDLAHLPKMSAPQR